MWIKFYFHFFVAIFAVIVGIVELFVLPKEQMPGGPEEPYKPSAGKLRACLGCKIIRSIFDFEQDGCPNCGDAHADVESNTTPNFTGLFLFFVFYLFFVFFLYFLNAHTKWAKINNKNKLIKEW